MAEDPKKDEDTNRPVSLSLKLPLYIMNSSRLSFYHNVTTLI